MAFSGWGRRAKGQPVIELFPAANLMGAKIEFERSFDDGEIFYKKPSLPVNNPALALTWDVRRTSGKARFRGLWP
jgi:hypothetical protein